MQTAPPVDPVSDEEFASRCAHLNIGDKIALAVSGGRDSMALAVLATGYAKNTGAALSAFTVDHGLRPEASAEASQAAQWCEALGIPHQTLVWSGEKPATGVQAAARRARYQLLATAAATAGVDALITAHSAGDQAETVFMRLARGAGPRGLAAMPAETMIAAGAGAPVRLLRPLLDVPRARLTATLDARNQSYVDDPGNDDPAYERIRVRALLAALDEQGLLSQSALLRTAGRMADSDRRLRRYGEQIFQSLSGCFYRWGGASLDLVAVRGASAGELSLAAPRLLHAVSASEHAPEETAAMAAVEKALTTGASAIGGAIMRIAGARMWFLREPAAVLGRAGVAPLAEMALTSGKPVLWDRRFIIEAAGGGEATIRPLGGCPGVISPAREALISGPEDAVAGIPGIFRRGALIAAPGFLSAHTSDLRIKSLAPERFSGAIVRYL